MEKSRKKAIRKEFRGSVFKRAEYRCECCGIHGYDRQSENDIEERVALDAHHITNRKEMPNDGNVKENGISVCDDCHLKAEQFHSTGVAIEGFSPDDLYKRINSSYEKAVRASKKLS